jgi:RHS repeat-associated protein
VKKNSVSMATFVYDGDGRRVKSTINGTTTTFVGSHYEVTGSQITKYYFAGTSRIAMRKYTIPQPMTVEYLLSDHLGSTSITTDKDGVKTSEMRYKPWGEVRYSWTSAPATTPTYMLSNYTFTGQYSYMDDPSTSGVTEGFGLMFYNARMYDPALGRFTSADSVLDNPITGWDRYAYVNNRPLSYSDPSGHDAKCTIQCEPHDVLNLGKLSKAGRNLYLAYIKMWNNADGWWWDEYGTDGAFTIDEFMAINWHYEQANFGNLKEYNAAVKNASASWSAHACIKATFSCDLSSAEGSLNFLGYYSQSARSRASQCGPRLCDVEKVFNYTTWDKESASELVGGIHDVTSTTEFGDWDWFAVGNVSLNEDVYRKMMLRGWIGKVVRGKDPMIILTYCQATFAWWAVSQGNKNHTSPLTYLNQKNYTGFCN